MKLRAHLRRLTLSISSRIGKGGFSRVELLTVLSTLFLLVLLAIPVLANTKPRADRVTCFNNLRQIGRAEHIWANDHRDQFPWRTDMSEGGTQRHPLQNNCWFNYGVMSNELATPTILACPSDQKTKVTRNFSSSPFEGFFAVGNRNASLSYFLTLDVPLFRPIAYGPGVFVAALNGDRNLQVDELNQQCSSGVTSASAIRPFPPTRAGWTNEVHGLSGNVLLVDGRVSQLSTPDAVRAIAPPVDDNGIYHLLIPR